MFFRMLLLSYCTILALAPGFLSAQPNESSSSALQKRIESRIAENPEDASAWRMLGKIRHRDNDLAGAREALEAAIQLDPSIAASHFDLAELLMATGKSDQAALHYQQAIAIAPGSDYAEDARDVLAHLSTEPEADVKPALAEFTSGAGGSGLQTDESPPLIEQAGFEISRFDTSAVAPDADEILEDQVIPNRLRVRLESGVVYNSNVTLTPINRELFPAAQDTAQFFLAPELEYRALDAGEWGAGPTFLGHFTFNEDSFSNLNLQSYQPGAFLERVFAGSPTIFVTRLQYGFTHDAFDGKTIGNRHSVMASTAAVWDICKPVAENDARDLTFSYFSADHTDILDDGVMPSLTSRDGWTYRLGAAHTFAVNDRFLRSIRVGADLEHADLAGDNFAYDGISTYVDGILPLTDTLTLKVEGGWGYRDYSDFTASPSRNENIWRAGTRLTKQLNDHWSIAGVFNYDRFDSKNEQFNSDRFLAGLVAIFER